MDSEITNYKKMAYQDIIAFISGQVKEPEFIQKYKVNAIKSHDYAGVISAILQRDDFMYDAKFAQSVAMQEADFEPLKRAGADYVANKLVQALFSVAYTRKPNNRIGGDGKPESYDRQRNIGPAAFVALRTLGSVPEYSIAMNHVYNEFFFPQMVEPARRTNLLHPGNILDLIRQDAQLTGEENVKLASQSRNI